MIRVLSDLLFNFHFVMIEKNITVITYNFILNIMCMVNKVTKCIMSEAFQDTKLPKTKCSNTNEKKSVKALPTKYGKLFLLDYCLTK